MARQQQPTSLATKRELGNLAQSIRTARLLRGLPAELVAQRAKTTRSTLHRIERGDPNVRIGTYLLTLQALGLHRGFGDIPDSVGDSIAAERLPKRARMPKR